MRPEPESFRKIRAAIAGIPGDLSNDAVGADVAELDDIYAPETHAAALAPNISWHRPATGNVARRC